MILDTNALSAWAEGLATVRPLFGPPTDLSFPVSSSVSIILAFANRVIEAATRNGFADICRWPKSPLLPQQRQIHTPTSAWN